MLQNWKSLQLKCGVLGCCLPLLVHQYHALTSEIEIISIGIHDLAASQHQFLDDTKRFVTSKNWCWLAGNFFGSRVMNQTKSICDSFLVIDNGKLHEISAH